MYTLHIFIQYGIYFWHELAYTLHYILIKLNWNICGTSTYFLLIWLALLIWTVLRHISCLNQTWIKIKSNWHVDHTSAFTQPIISSCLHTNICMQTRWQVSCQHRSATPLIRRAWINNHRTGYYSRYEINNLRVIYMILCIMRGWYDE